ncbi:MAG: S6e family ribosomal protein [Candidatus Bathyarchaeia archaeon]
MAKFKVSIAIPEAKEVKTVELEGSRAAPLVGREIGDIVDGSLVGMPGKRVRITGGSDKDGIPMRGDVHGGGKKYVLLSGPPGFRPKIKGLRKRKLVRGRMITDETYQINMVVLSDSEGRPDGGEDRKGI